MGAEERQPDASLSPDDRARIAALAKQARGFDFFRLIYLLERIHPEAPRVGHTGPARDERIRLRADPSMSFAASDVSRLELRQSADGEERVQIDAAFLGLYGTVSPLPAHFVEKIAAGVHQGGPQPIRELLDVIHHRLFSLVYRAWSKYRHTVGYVRRGEDAFTRRMLCAVGVDGFARPSARALDRFHLLRFAPLLTSKSRPARGLQIALDELLEGIPVAIEQFVGAWTPIDKPLRNALGVANHQLGESLVLGRYVYDGGGRFTIRLGPLDYDAYLSFLPGGYRRPFLQAIVSTFSPGTHDVMLELHVDLESAPKFQLGAPRASTLSRTAWLGGSTASESFSITVPLHDGAPTDDRGESPPL